MKGATRLPFGCLVCIGVIKSYSIILESTVQSQARAKNLPDEVLRVIIDFTGYRKITGYIKLVVRLDIVLHGDSGNLCALLNATDQCAAMAEWLRRLT